MEQTNTTSKIKTFIRLRPFLYIEKQHNRAESGVAYDESNSTIHITKSGKTVVIDQKISAKMEAGDTIKNPDLASYKFDKIFSPTANQEQIFQNVAKPAVDNIFDGYNSTIFAFGSTGTGKTHTIIGYGEQRGLYPRVLEDVFGRIGALGLEDKAVVCLTFLEIYNEKLRDLGVSGKNGGIKLKEAPDGVQVENLTEIKIKDSKEGLILFEKARERRATCTTMMSIHSSRSHIVYGIKLILPTSDTGPKKYCKKSNLIPRYRVPIEPC